MKNDKAKIKKIILIFDIYILHLNKTTQTNKVSFGVPLVRDGSTQIVRPLGGPLVNCSYV